MIRDSVLFFCRYLITGYFLQRLMPMDTKFFHTLGLTLVNIGLILFLALAIEQLFFQIDKNKHSRRFLDKSTIFYQKHFPQDGLYLFEYDEDDHFPPKPSEKPWLHV